MIIFLGKNVFSFGDMHDNMSLYHIVIDMDRLIQNKNKNYTCLVISLILITLELFIWKLQQFHVQRYAILQ